MLVKTLKAVHQNCKEENTAGPKIKTEGRFYNAAQYLIYRGIDKKLARKDFTNYADKEEKAKTDHTCKRINSTIKYDADYKIVK